jgi:hypothetical protein
VQESAQHGHVLLVSHYIYLLWVERMKLNHSFYSAFLPTLDAAIEISRPQRIAILCLAILANMAFSAYFFGTNTNSLGQVRGLPVCLPQAPCPSVGMGFPWQASECCWHSRAKKWLLRPLAPPPAAGVSIRWSSQAS